MAGQDRPGEIMKCFTSTSLPVLHALAREFVVCDNWYSSMPRPEGVSRWVTYSPIICSRMMSPNKAIRSLIPSSNPATNVLTDYKGSTSQHPPDDVTRGEMLIKAT